MLSLAQNVGLLWKHITMRTPREKRINPAGDGNCGYSAYACSLMAYLRFHPVETQKTVFNNLCLSEEIKNRLIIFLDNGNENKKNWTDQDWKEIALRLRKPLRDAAAKRTAEILKKWANNPHDFSNSDEYAAIVATTLTLENMILKEKNQLPMTIGENTYIRNLKKFIQPNYLDDIEMVSGISREIKEYVKENAAKITQETITNHVAAFLKSNDYFYIRSYEEYLKTNRVWASQETLSLLHKLAFDGCDDKPLTEIRSEDAREKAPKSGTDENRRESIRIINQGGRHWVSHIPGEFLIPEKATHAPSFFQSVTRLGETVAEHPVLVPLALVTSFLLCCGAIGVGIASVVGALLLCIAAIFLATTLTLTANHIYQSSFGSKR